MIFQTTGKFVTVFVRFVLGKITGSRREIDIKYEFDFELLRKALGFK